MRKMIYLTCLSLFTLVSTTIYAADDQKDVSDTVNAFVMAWNNHNPEEMSALWVEDGDLIDPWGIVANNRDEVKKVFSQDQAGRFKASQMTQTVEKVRTLGPDFALVDVKAVLSGAQDSEGKTLDPIEHHVVFLMAKQDGSWKIVAARPYLLEEANKGA